MCTMFVYMYNMYNMYMCTYLMYMVSQVEHEVVTDRALDALRELNQEYVCVYNVCIQCMYMYMCVYLMYYGIPGGE